MLSSKLSDVFQIIKPEYVYLKLKPNNSIRNNSTHKLARSISNLYKNVIENIEHTEEKLVRLLGKDYFIPSKFQYHPNSKISYYIYMENKKIEFYFIVPKHQLMFIKEKITDVWSNITIEEVKEIPFFSSDSTKLQIYYNKEDALSLAIDRRNNDLLNSNLNVVEMLEENDKLGIFYNFMPTTQHAWKHKHRTTIEKVKSNKPIERNKTGWRYIFKWTISAIDSAMNTFSDALMSSSSNKSSNQSDSNSGLINNFILALNNKKFQISDATLKKGNSAVLEAQIVVLAESGDKFRQRNQIKSLAQSFDTISQDNELVYKPQIKHFSPTDYSTGSIRNIIGDEEAQNFLSIAGRDVLERYNFIDSVETFETEVPEDLQSGVMCIGENIYRGKGQKAYLSNDREFRNLLTLLIGPTRAGKSNLIANLSIDAIEAGECVVIFDFIENCELSNEVSKCFSKDKVLEIRCDDFEMMQGLGFNEVGQSTDVFKQYENAKRQTSNMLTLVNSINSDDSRLSPKMERYLESASLVVFINSGSIKDVFSVLHSHKVRHNYLSRVPIHQLTNLEEYIESLLELDEKDKEDNVTGTKLNLIVGIVDRLNSLKRNTYTELMLKKDTKNNINLVDEMQKNQLITIKLPQHMFTVESEKDTLVLYFLQKLWLAAQIRSEKIRDKSKRTKCNLIIDEIYQTPCSEKFVTSKLSQMAKFIVKPIISCHYINQLNYMRDELRSANTSYLLLAGCDKKNFDELKSELYPFVEEDLRNLKRYHSMNYIKNSQGYSRFITKLPGDVTKRIKQNKKTV
ncbi:hypothetical protein [Paenibacillus sp. Marseille-Q4541]|uniref:hypothetical protein n=1 Tax=Paenibacillus sp. Marseille-Q4541 TaxID=2831522 RepID=UPI001BA580EB|nr:hypothetical protein [Paenibacillus sp. Marseille-Q4541]